MIPSQFPEYKDEYIWLVGDIRAIKFDLNLIEFIVVVDLIRMHDFACVHVSINL